MEAKLPAGEPRRKRARAAASSPAGDGDGNGRGDGARVTTATPVEEPAGAASVASVGETIKRLRTQMGLSLRDLATASGLSASFLGAVERAESDIALGRLARVAAVFGHDVGSFLGYTSRRVRPSFIDEAGRRTIDRGERVDYQAINIPGVGLELIVATFEPHSALRDELQHVGMDIVYVPFGEIVVVYNEQEYVMTAGTCGYWPAGYPHTFRNDGDERAQFVAIVTGNVF